jgi:hypothetical protein
MTIGHDEDEDTVLSSWWFKLPVYNPEKERGGSIWVPVHVPEKDTNLLTDEYICDFELVCRDGEWSFTSSANGLWSSQTSTTTFSPSIWVRNG